MVFTTSYISQVAKDYLSAITSLIDPKVVVEIGTQLGISGVCIAKEICKEGEFISFDTYTKEYVGEPKLPTHANLINATKYFEASNIRCNWKLLKGTYIKVDNLFTSIDLLHIDICNHYDNLKPILEILLHKVTRAIIIEGGIKNHWMKKYNFKSYLPMLSEDWIKKDWKYIIIRFDENHATTLLIRRTK